MAECEGGEGIGELTARERAMEMRRSDGCGIGAGEVNAGGIRGE